MAFSPASPVVSTVAGRRLLALAMAGVVFATSAALPALAFELFGRKFFEKDDQTAIVPDAKRYTLTFTVAGGDKSVEKALREASSLAREAKRPPPGTAGLLARARGDYGRLVAALYGRGYYGGSIAISIGGEPAEALRPDAVLPDPVPVRVAVDPGPLFHFGEIRIDGMPQGPFSRDEAKALDRGKWELTRGAVARSGAILSVEGRLVETWRQRGHPKAAIAKRDIVADHRSHQVDVTLTVAPGPEASFGAVDISGTERVDPAYARFMTGINPGAKYDPDTIAGARKRLQDTGVFASVAITEGDVANGLLPVGFALSERKRHLIGGGVSYATIDGGTVEGYWMHRNLFGHAESLRFDAKVSRIGAENLADTSYLLATTFRRPGVFTPDTDATLKLSAEREFVDTYESRTVAAKAGLEHRVNERLTLTTAFNTEWSDIDDAFGNSRYLLVSLPSMADYDGRDNKLDPTKGLRGTFEAEPLVDVLNGTVALIGEATGSGYYSVTDDDRVVIAARGSVGSIVGADVEDIPATRRFYLGGGGSIRGFGYRSVGPKLGGDVIGGLSFFETSLELRLRLTDTIGLVPFIDAGAAYPDAFPDFSEPVKIGAGIGLRYLTPLGPLRFDVAIPLNPEHGDPHFAFYVGLGQSF